jgi:hypothetical protein
MSSSKITDIIRIIKKKEKDIENNYYYLIKHNNNYYLDEIKPHPYLYFLISFINEFINRNTIIDKFITILNFINWFDMFDNYYNNYFKYNLDIKAEKYDVNIKTFNSIIKNCNLDIIKNILINNNIDSLILFFNYLKKVLKTIFNEDLYIIDTIINNLYKINNKEIDNNIYDNIDLKYQTDKYIINSFEIATYDIKGQLIYDHPNQNINVNLYKKYINNPIIINIFRDFNNYLKKKIVHPPNDDKISSKLLDNIQNYKLYYNFIIISNNKDEIKNFIKINTITNDITNNNIISNNKNLIEYDNHLIFNNNDINYRYNIYGYIHNNIFSTTNSNELFDYIIYKYQDISDINSIANPKFNQYYLDKIKLKYNNNSCYINNIIISLFNSKHKAIFDLLYFLTPITYNDSTFKSNISNDKYYNHVLELKEKLLSSFSNLDNDSINNTREEIRNIFYILTKDETYKNCEKDINDIFKLLQKIYINFNIQNIDVIQYDKPFIENINLLYDYNKFIYINSNILALKYNIDTKFKFKNTTLKINSLILYYNHNDQNYTDKKVYFDNNVLQEGGHYVCLVNNNNKWFLYNDLSNNNSSNDTPYPYMWEYENINDVIEDALKDYSTDVLPTIDSIGYRYIVINVKSPNEYIINYRKCYIYSILYIAE